MSRLVVVASLWLIACKSTPAPTARPRSPVQVSWQEVRRDATQVELIARVQRLAPLPFPLEVSIALPEGATLKTGRSRFTLAPNLEGETHDEAMVVAYAKLPEGDLLLAADGQTAEMGVHARMAYRFGRPAPLQDAVAPAGPDLKKGDQNLGPSIPLGPR